MKQTLYSSLAGYSSLACSILPVYNADAQIIYTGIPDTVVTHHDDYYLDLNDDGVWEFDFRVGRYYFSYDRIRYARCEDGHNCDQVAAKYNGHSYWPRHLKAGKEIGPDMPFAFETYFDLQRITYNYHDPLKIGLWAGGAVDGFLGVKIFDHGKSYYGWIRLDVTKDGKKMRFKDYAYEASGNPIIAGDNGMNKILPRIENNKIEIYPNPASQFIIVAGIETSSQTQYSIIDVQGRVQKLLPDLSTENNKIDISELHQGTYLLLVTSEGQSQVVKFNVE